MNEFPPAQLQYPSTRRGDHVDILHGITVPDPYRWLEEVDSAETAAWTDAQNALAQSVLGAIPFRAAIRERLTALSDYEAVGVPLEAGGRLFFTLQKPDARQPALCWVETGGDDVRVAVDPDALADDGTVSITEFSPSPCGRYLAYGLAEAGSDWQTWRILDVETGEHLSEKIEWLKFPVPSWLPDSSGFFYGGSEPPPPDGVFKAAATNRSLRFHRLGDPQIADDVVLEYPDEPQWRPYGRVTADGRYLVITVYRGTYRENRINFVDLAGNEREVVDLIPAFDAAYTFLGNRGRTLFFLTTHDAPLGRIIAVDVERPAPESWSELVPESEDTIEAAAYIGERFVICTLREAVARLSIHGRDAGWIRDIELPGEGSVPLIEGRERGTKAYFSYGDFVHPNIVLSHDVAAGETIPFRGQDLPFDPDTYETEKHVVEAADGVRVPVFVARKRGVSPGPDTPTFLYGYGGFNIAMSPHFKIDHLSWLDLGGQLVVACIRGGGEFGRAWHQAGAKENRPNVFSDFIAIAEWLVETRRTSIPKLAIYGRSNGGLLVGACMTKRPDLFGACLPTVGVLDMLRFHLFTVGSFWVSDYGSPDDPEMFPVLLGYSPYHSVAPGTAYPPTLVTTADHDDRVYPAHSHKFAAALQSAQSGEAPILLRVDKRAGHGLGKPKGKLLDEVADRWAFAFAALGAEPRR
jgi:prolyl oligopeptidase